ncbi:MAG: amino acid ABC transporter permease [Clostridia bacterium]|nr:amino acid ABC transporter permease [Clostridia bacterium]
MVKFFLDVAAIFRDYWQVLLQGIGYTLAGLLIGLLTGVIRTAPMSGNGFVRVLQIIINKIIAVYIEIFRGTPMMVQAMVIYWGYAFANNGNTLNLLASGIIIVSINTGAYMAEIVRGGIISIDKGQTEGALAIGMNHSQLMLFVIIPQLIRNILPSVSNEFVINIKDTSVLNVIGVTELYYFAAVIKRQNFQTFQTYLVVCMLYFVLTFSVTRILRYLEKRLSGRENYVICGSQSDPDAEIRIENGKESSK